MNKASIVWFGITTGMCAAAVAGAADVIAVAWAGAGLPWYLPPALLGVYLAGGLLAGTAIGIAATLCHRRDAPDCAEHIRPLILTTWVLAVAGLQAINLIDHHSHERLSAGGLGAAALTTASILTAALVLAHRLTRKVRRTEKASSSPEHADHRPTKASPADCLWSILCLTIAGLVWPIFHRSYQAPAISLTNVGMQILFIGLALGIYTFGRFIGQCLRAQRSRTLTPRAMIGTLASAAIIACAMGMLAGARPPIASAAIADPTPPGSTAPPVILLVMDTTRADHLSAYGYPRNTSPNLAAFAQEAVRYERAVAPSSWTLPAHASILTGLMPTAHGADVEVQSNGFVRFQPLAEGYTTLAEVLQSLGYSTGAVVANTLLLTREYGLNQGFAFYDDQPRTSITTADPRTVSPARWIIRLLQGDAGHRAHLFRQAEDIQRRATAWLDRGAYQPYFLFLNYMDAHEPYEPHREWARQIDVPTDVRPQLYDRVAADCRDNVDAYDRSIAYLDAQIGRLFDHLRQRGDYDRALIIVTADHGEAFGEHGPAGHGLSVYEEEIHVPLLVRYPHGARRGIVKEPISLTAIPRLVLSAINPELAASPECDLAHPPAQVLSELRTFRNADFASSHLIRGHYAPQSLKTIFDRDLADGCAVFDLPSDPHETVNLAPTHPEHVAAIRAWTRQWETTALDQRLTSDPTLTDSAELRDRLKALGYLSD